MLFRLTLPKWSSRVGYTLKGGGGLHWRGPSGGKQRFAVRVVWQGLPAEGLARPEAHGRHSEQHRYA